MWACMHDYSVFISVQWLISGLGYNKVILLTKLRSVCTSKYWNIKKHCIFVIFIFISCLWTTSCSWDTGNTGVINSHAINFHIHTPALKWFSFCRRNCSSLGQQTFRVTLTLVARCKHRLTSTCMNFWHLCQKKMPSRSGADGWQPIHCLPHWYKTLHHRPTWSAFFVCKWLTAGCRNRLSKNLEMCVFLKLNKDLVWLCNWVDSRLLDDC